MTVVPPRPVFGGARSLPFSQSLTYKVLHERARYKIKNL